MVPSHKSVSAVPPLQQWPQLLGFLSARRCPASTPFHSFTATVTVVLLHVCLMLPLCNFCQFPKAYLSRQLTALVPLSCVPPFTTNPNMQSPECKKLYRMLPELIRSLHVHICKADGFQRNIKINIQSICFG